MKKKPGRKLTVNKEIVITLTVRPEVFAMAHHWDTSTYNETCIGGVSDMICVLPGGTKPRTKKKQARKK